MKLKADENVPARIVDLLREFGHDVITVPEEDPVGAPDARLASETAADDQTLLTLDRGFADIRRYRPGTHPGVFVVHARELRPGILHDLVASFLKVHTFDEFAGCNVVTEPGAVRARRPHPE